MLLPMRRILATGLAMLVASTAWAQEASVEALREAAGADPLGVAVTAGAKLAQVKLKLICDDGRTVERSESPVPAGRRILFRLDRSEPGTVRCTGTLSILDATGGGGDMPLDLTFVRRAALTLEVPRERVDLEGRSLWVRPSQPLTGLELSVLDPDAVEMVLAEPTVSSQGGGWVRVRWEQRDGEVVLLRVTGRAGAAAWTQELSPWHVEIPHDEVVFDSGRHAIRSDQASKLSATYELIAAAVRRYGKLVEPNLYIVGYTDTVGSAEANKALSLRRATSIARAFLARGFRGSVYVWGLGEEVLAVTTPDEIDEEANRRAIYILAAEVPPPSPAVPYAEWRQVD
jgi:outer membrane protein OmpA-like peptidoglycan-associated protein